MLLSVVLACFQSACPEFSYVLFLFPPLGAPTCEECMEHAMGGTWRLADPVLDFVDRKPRLQLIVNGRWISYQIQPVLVHADTAHSLPKSHTLGHSLNPEHALNFHESQRLHAAVQETAMQCGRT